MHRIQIIIITIIVFTLNTAYGQSSQTVEVEFITSPIGASIIVDGQLRGVSNLKVNLAAGVYQIQIENDKQQSKTFKQAIYGRTWQVRVNLADNEAKTALDKLEYLPMSSWVNQPYWSGSSNLLWFQTTDSMPSTYILDVDKFSLSETPYPLGSIPIGSEWRSRLRVRHQQKWDTGEGKLRETFPSEKKEQADGKRRENRKRDGNSAAYPAGDAAQIQCGRKDPHCAGRAAGRTQHCGAVPPRRVEPKPVLPME